MNTSQYEAVKLSMKQDATGYVLTLRIHPDEVPEEILRDFVGARYQVVMVRLDSDDQPMTRQPNYVQLAGMLCKNSAFHQFLVDRGYVFDATETEATDWLRMELGIKSRKELEHNEEAIKRLRTINQDFQSWQQND